eukprot:scaffold215714_cov35-Tisochrysis_lutea.AAC.3
MGREASGFGEGERIGDTTSGVGGARGIVVSGCCASSKTTLVQDLFCSVFFHSTTNVELFLTLKMRTYIAGGFGRLVGRELFTAPRPPRRTSAFFSFEGTPLRLVPIESLNFLSHSKLPCT